MENLIRGVGSSGDPECPMSAVANGSGSSDIFIPDRTYEASPGIAEALGAVRSGAPVVLISGRAGTGKSKLIDYLRKIPGGDGTVVVAPTGISAIELDAMTIHKSFELPHGVINASELPALSVSRIFQEATRLIIDEISMVRADVLDGIDARLRAVRQDERPFGGLQVIMVGDFLQLPPVLLDEERTVFERLGYDNRYAISARCLRGMTVRVAHLSKVWRQTDLDLINTLSDIRVGRNLNSALKWLNDNCVGPHRDGRTPIVLAATREVAKNYNRAGFLNTTQGRSDKISTFCFGANKTGVFENPATPSPAPDELWLAAGVRVMSVKNDPSGRYFNGSLGTVLSCHPDGDEGFVRVLFDNKADPVEVSRGTWIKTKQRWCSENDRIVRERAGSFSQIPLVHGYAVTIHKSQGLSLDDVRIDLGQGSFAPGQLYVALSRARSPSGLSLVRPVAPEDIKVDEVLLNFLSSTVRSNVTEK